MVAVFGASSLNQSREHLDAPTTASQLRAGIGVYRLPSRSLSMRKGDILCDLRYQSLSVDGRCCIVGAPHPTPAHAPSVVGLVLVLFSAFSLRFHVVTLPYSKNGRAYIRQASSPLQLQSLVAQRPARLFCEIQRI